MKSIRFLKFAVAFISHFCSAQLVSSNLPIIIIETNGRTIMDEPKVNVAFKILYHLDGSANYLTDTDYHYNGNAGIEFRGASSQGFPKKSYAVELRDALGADIKFAAFGFPEESDWVLIANYDDKTYLKNAYIYDLWAKTSYYSPKTKHVELVIDGEYMGLYIFTEKIKRDANRINIKKLETKDTTAAKISGGYIVEASREASINLSPYAWLSEYTSSPASSYSMYFECIYPKEPVTKQLNYIKQYMDEFEDALKSPNFKDSVLGFRKYIEEDSFVENFVMEEYSIHYDIFARSQYFYKDRGTKLVASPMWDTSPGLFDDYATSWRFSCGGCDPRFFWVERMMQDCDFKNKVISKYKDFRQSFLTYPKGSNFVDSLYNVIQYAAERDRKKWFPSATISFVEEVQKLKNFIQIRLNWMDLNIHNIVNDGKTLVSVANNEKINQFTLISDCSNDYPVIWRFDNSDGATGTFTGTNTTDILISQNATYTAICQTPSCVQYTNIQSMTFNNACLDKQNFSSHITNPQIQNFDTKYEINSSANLTSKSKVTYSAGNSVQLNPGFQVPSGAVFIAKIEGCQ